MHVIPKKLRAGAAGSTVGRMLLHTIIVSTVLNTSEIEIGRIMIPRILTTTMTLG
jgi:hypothetical protein